MLCSGTPFDWSKCYTQAHTAYLYLGAKSPSDFMSVTHVGVATSSVGQKLCKLTFSSATPVPTLPAVTYSQCSTSYPLAILFCGEQVDKNGVVLDLVYSTATMLLDIAATVYPNHATDEVGSLYYKVVADGVTLAEGTATSGITIAIDRAVTHMTVTLSCDVGCVTGGWLPRTALPSRSLDLSKGGMVCDLSGNWFPVQSPIVVAGTRILTSMEIDSLW